MPLEKKKRTGGQSQERFLDGVLVPLISEQHIITAERPYRLPFGFRTVGSRRFYAARVADETITAMIATPLTDATFDLFEIGGTVEIRSNRTGTRRLFSISQTETKYDAIPPCIYLTLKDPGIALTDNREKEAER